MMKLWLLMFLLLLSNLIHDAQGIRLIKDSSPSAHHEHHDSIHEEVAEILNEGGEVCIGCSKKKNSGRLRKLITMIHISSSTTTTTIAKNNKNGEITRKEENLSVNSSSNTKTDLQEDLSEMDYSLQARRKPPIHN